MGRAVVGVAGFGAGHLRQGVGVRSCSREGDVPEAGGARILDGHSIIGGHGGTGHRHQLEGEGLLGGGPVISGDVLPHRQRQGGGGGGVVVGEGDLDTEDLAGIIHVIAFSVFCSKRCHSIEDNLLSSI